MKKSRESESINTGTTPLFARNISVRDLRTFLTLLSSLPSELKECLDTIASDQEIFFREDTEKSDWCYLYELPIEQQHTVVLSKLAQYNEIPGLPSLTELAIYSLSLLRSQESPLGGLPEIVSQIENKLAAIHPTEAQKEQADVFMAAQAGCLYSLTKTIDCLFYYGCYLNTLIQRARSGDDKSLFNAIRIDPAVLGFQSVRQRICKATLLEDDTFFRKLKIAIRGKMGIREKVSFQQMRMVLHVLHEAGAERLSDTELNYLFIKELQLYAANEHDGGSQKALRKFADNFIKEKSTT